MYSPPKKKKTLSQERASINRKDKILGFQYKNPEHLGAAAATGLGLYGAYKFSNSQAQKYYGHGIKKAVNNAFTRAAQTVVRTPSKFALAYDSAVKEAASHGATKIGDAAGVLSRRALRVIYGTAIEGTQRKLNSIVKKRFGGWRGFEDAVQLAGHNGINKLIKFEKDPKIKSELRIAANKVISNTRSIKSREDFIDELLKEQEALATIGPARGNLPLSQRIARANRNKVGRRTDPYEEQTQSDLRKLSFTNKDQNLNTQIVVTNLTSKNPPIHAGAVTGQGEAMAIAIENYLSNGGSTAKKNFRQYLANLDSRGELTPYVYKAQKYPKRFKKTFKEMESFLRSQDKRG